MKIQHTGPAKDHFYNTVGEAIRMARHDGGMSAEVLAREAGVGLTTIQHAEEGTSCSLLLAAKIAEALDITIDELVPVEALP